MTHCKEEIDPCYWTKIVISKLSRNLRSPCLYILPRAYSKPYIWRLFVCPRGNKAAERGTTNLSERTHWRLIEEQCSKYTFIKHGLCLVLKLAWHRKVPDGARAEDRWPLAVWCSDFVGRCDMKFLSMCGNIHSINTSRARFALIKGSANRTIFYGAKNSFVFIFMNPHLISCNAPSRVRHQTRCRVPRPYEGL